MSAHTAERRDGDIEMVMCTRLANEALPYMAQQLGYNLHTS